MYHNNLIIFTRHPTPGQTKTRLTPLLGPVGAANLSKKMTEATVQVAEKFCKKTNSTLEIRFSGQTEKEMKRWLGKQFNYKSQGEGDLGVRMLNAFNNANESGAKKTVIIGTDCPGIDEKILMEAFQFLENDDLVLGPASDGGYYLIGLKKVEPSLFHGIDWSTEKVFVQTMKTAAAKRLSVKFLETLDDIDRPEDLASLKNNKVGPSKSKISVIIPTLNESENIAATLFGLRDAENVEVIVVDGGSGDKTIEIAKMIGIFTIHDANGRACQMNAGANNTSGEILLFLHADTFLPAGFEEDVRAALEQSNVVAGAFTFTIDGDGLGLRVIEKLANFRSKKMHRPYGDQAIFIKKEIFHKIGGFPEFPIMDDYKFVRRLKKRGEIVTLPTHASTSGRRWKKRGLFKTTIINQAVIIGYHLGIPPTRLAKWYR